MSRRNWNQIPYFITHVSGDLFLTQRSPVVQHYKGQLYAVIIPSIQAFTHPMYTSQRVVVYQALYGQHIWWCRPYHMFHTANRFIPVHGQFHDHKIQLREDGIVARVHHTEMPSLSYDLTVFSPLFQPELMLRLRK
jgi:hypothetical protein